MYNTTYSTEVDARYAFKHEVKHPASFDSSQEENLNTNHEIFCFYFGPATAKIFTNYKKYLPKKVPKTLNFFSEY